MSQRPSFELKHIKPYHGKETKHSNRSHQLDEFFIVYQDEVDALPPPNPLELLNQDSQERFKEYLK